LAGSSRVHPDDTLEKRHVENSCSLSIHIMETFELVIFSNYKVEERVLYLGETRAWIGDATWKRLDRATVEALVGGKV
jgi:hypothetical protein